MTATRTIYMSCRTQSSATAIVDEHKGYFGAGFANSVHVDSVDPFVIQIKYFDVRWPVDIIDWALEQRHVTANEAARVRGIL